MAQFMEINEAAIAAARAQINAAYDKMMALADLRVTRGEFMTSLRQGTLPPEALKIFWLNWHGFVAEINNFIQVAYQRHLGFFQRNRDLLAPFADKVADELIHPRPPGHIAIVWEQGKTFGINTPEEMIHYPMLPLCRSLNEWHRGVLYEGTMVEFWSAIAWEEYVGHWAGMFRDALLKQYHFPAEAVPYFQTHEEADLQEHEGGVMAHGEFNKTVLTRLVAQGQELCRPGLSIEYCMTTSIEYFAWFHQACLDAAR